MVVVTPVSPSTLTCDILVEHQSLTSKLYYFVILYIFYSSLFCYYVYLLVNKADQTLPVRRSTYVQLTCDHLCA